MQDLIALVDRVMDRPRGLSVEDREFCERRFISPNVSRQDAWQIGEALAWLQDNKR